MIEFHLTYFVAVFLAAALAGLAWVGVTALVPALRNRPGLRYGGAIALSWAPALLAADGLTIYSVVATLAFNAALSFAAFYLACGRTRRDDSGSRGASIPAH